MNLLTIQKKYNTQQKCISYLEKLRWGNKPISPFTGKDNVTQRKGTFKYHCNDTNNDFTVLYGTIFQDTRLPLPKWFILIGLMLNAKKGIPSTQLARDLGISYKTAWYGQMRVRCCMVETDLQLDGLLEMDESFVGGKPRKKYNPHNKSIANLSQVTNKRGRGTAKISYVGLAEKKGQISTKVINKLSGVNLLAMLKRYAKMDDSAVITDNYAGYKKLDGNIEHITLAERNKYAKTGILNTSTVDNFFSLVKKGIKGNYIVLSRKYLPFYLIEFQYKFNKRNEKTDAFEKLLKRAVSDGKCMLNYKPVSQVRAITNPSKKRVISQKKSKIAI